MEKVNMELFGFVGRFPALAAMYPGFHAARILSQHKDLYKAVCEGGELMAEVSGKLRYGASLPCDYPAVGDFVMLDRITDAGGNAIIHHLLPRRSVFSRSAAGTSGGEQIVAGNIDIVFICMSLNNDFNLRRLERYLSIAWESGAVPIVVLTKSDLCGNLACKIDEVRSVAVGADILVTSAFESDSCAQVAQRIKRGETVAFVGSSGVGKSTLINGLIGENRLDTNDIRGDDKGRHTTTRRELILLPGGGMVIDTPGMRELGIESADFSKSFADIDELSKLCKFKDCTHGGEPGCAVQKAIANGDISPDRLQSYQKLTKEAKYEGLNSKQIEHTKLNEMFGGIGGMKNARKFLKEKNSHKNRF